MLSLFPQILFLSPIAITLLRVTAAITCAIAGYRQYERRASLPRGITPVSIIGHTVLVILLFIGLYTQVAALLAALGAIVGLFPPERLKPMVTFPKSSIILFIVICISLVFMGAGAFAFDLPL